MLLRYTYIYEWSKLTLNVLKSQKYSINVEFFKNKILFWKTIRRYLSEEYITDAI